MDRTKWAGRPVSWKEFEEVARTFFRDTPMVFRIPGRVNLIGEHTDYNDGFVLPGATSRGIWLGVGLQKQTDRVTVRSQDLDRTGAFSLPVSSRDNSQWYRYFQGVFLEAKRRELPHSGLRILVGGDLPIGSGMSSSSALTCGLLAGMNQLFDWKLDSLQLAQMGQLAEHQTGLLGGIMDQLSIFNGRRDHLILLDCRDLSYRYVPFDSARYLLFLADTGVKHDLVRSPYNDRRADCQRVLRRLQEIDPGIRSLRDISLESFRGLEGELDAIGFQRVVYVLEENDRVNEIVSCLESGQIDRIGEILYAGHEGLSRSYEVSCPELDRMVELARTIPGILGARLMGGGFGGCTINLVQKGAAVDAMQELTKRYRQKSGIGGKTMEVELTNGISLVNS